MSENLKEKITALVNPIVIAMGYVLWGLEFHSQGGHTLLRIYLDAPNGVSLDDCQKVSEQLGALLDVEDIIKHHYKLEVSSPGFYRSLFTPEQFAKYVGSNIKVKLKIALQNQRNYVGKLEKVLADDIVVLVDGKESVLPMAAIEKANLID